MASRELCTFYTYGTEDKELCSGYLYKSPPASLIKSQVKTNLNIYILIISYFFLSKFISFHHDLLTLQKSWKRRFFVLKKNKTSCQLEYFKNEEKTKTELLGAIDLSQVSLMFMCPETHSMWKWVHKNFKCSAACVLFMKVMDRDYFFIGESSWEVERWFRALFDAMKNRPHRLLNPQDSGRIRDISEPPHSQNTDQVCLLFYQTKKSKERLDDCMWNVEECRNIVCHYAAGLFRELSGHLKRTLLLRSAKSLSMPPQ
uniref:PH domain-containing protein n=1 Tax=Pygocentrus nattereri TaxID=42514 RepID=A0AAR2IQJ6_PYGNA